MSTQYTTEPPPTATVLVHTTAGPLTISLFASQTPLTCRNFLQHCLDGYYDNNIFHRVATGFVIQTGDPTGTGEGGQSIYDDREFEKLDADWAKLLRTDEGESIQFGDELHSRLKFSRRGLVGMAKGTGENGGYGSQFFITLGDCRTELEGKCTMFGRVEGDGIYNIVKIADGELLEGTERPMYPDKILRVEVVERPKGDAWQKIQRRERVAARTQEPKEAAKKKPVKKKGGKALLSFGGEDGEEDGASLIKPKKPKFNTALIDSAHADADRSHDPRAAASAHKKAESNVDSRASPRPLPPKRKAEAIAPRSPSSKRRKPSFHDSTTQLPLRNPESASRSPTPNTPQNGHGHRRRSSLHQPKDPPDLAAEIAALKASMRRDMTVVSRPTKKQSALESLIPATSTRGRRRPKAGEANSQDDHKSMNVLDAFKARLEGAVGGVAKPKMRSNAAKQADDSRDEAYGEAVVVDDDEARLCDLHFIANCQSCFPGTNDQANNTTSFDDNLDHTTFLTHSLTFEKDRLGKDLTWKKKNEDELVVIDPRERERDLGLAPNSKDGRLNGKTGDRDHSIPPRRDRKREHDHDKDREREPRTRR